MKPVKDVVVRTVGTERILEDSVADVPLRNAVNALSKSAWHVPNGDKPIIPLDSMSGTFLVNECYDPNDVKELLESLGNTTPLTKSDSIFVDTHTDFQRGETTYSIQFRKLHYAFVVSVDALPEEVAKGFTFFLQKIDKKEEI